jgi:hypothetical protein
MSHTTNRFDTLTYAKDLERAGIPHDQAKIQTEMFAEVFQEVDTVKQDVAALRSETKQEISASRNETKQEILALKNDMDVKFAIVDAKFSELKFEIIRWVLGIVLSVSVAQGTLVISLLRILH